jgi:hypothetical protein
MAIAPGMKKRKEVPHREESAVAQGSGDGDAFAQYRDEVLRRVPTSVAARFLEGGFCKWGKEWLPVLELGPFDVAPGPVRDAWLEMCEEVSRLRRTAFRTTPAFSFVFRVPDSASPRCAPLPPES